VLALSLVSRWGARFGGRPSLARTPRFTIKGTESPFVTFSDMSSEATNNRNEGHVVRSSGRTRRILTIIIGISFIGMLGLIALLWLSDFPGPTQGSVDKSEAPPEDARRSQ
jgi:hypothetical protein